MSSASFILCYAVLAIPRFLSVFGQILVTQVFKRIFKSQWLRPVRSFDTGFISTTFFSLDLIVFSYVLPHWNASPLMLLASVSLLGCIVIRAVRFLRGDQRKKALRGPVEIECLRSYSVFYETANTLLSFDCQMYVLSLAPISGASQGRALVIYLSPRKDLIEESQVLVADTHVTPEGLLLLPLRLEHLLAKDGTRQEFKHRYPWVQYFTREGGVVITILVVAITGVVVFNLT